MKKNYYTPQQIEKIQLNILALLYYVKMHDKSQLPGCFQSLERIVKNIDVCRNNNYDDIDELSNLISSDWKSAMIPRVGLCDYFIYDNNAEIRESMNTALCDQISVLNKLMDI